MPRAAETSDTVCPICGAPIVQPKTGRPRVYCSQAHRQQAFAMRWPLGAKHLRDLGLDPDLARVSLAADLKRIGIDPFT